MTLSDAENSAAAYSPRLKAALYEQSAAEERAGTQKTQFYPRLSLDGSYKYVTNVQEIVLPIAGFEPVKFGDNTSYSLGPVAVWTAWDSGVISNAYKSAASAAEAKKNEAEAVRRQIVLAARAAYFQVALSGEQVTLYSDALKLANAQYEDIRVNVKAGTKSRADELQAHQEVLARMKQLRQAQADMASALRDLSSVTGQEYDSVKLENIDSMLAKFEPYKELKLNENHPNLQMYAKTAESAEYAKRGAGAGGWPKVQLSAKSSVEYPNGNQLESYGQNMLGASFNWTFFEAGAVRKRVNEYENSRSAGLQRREQSLADLKRDWAKTMDQLSNLEDQRKLNEVSVEETGQLSQIIYKTYKTGSISFLEVENANFKALEAKIQSATTKMQMLMNFAVLANLSE
jgi:outer membrane protein TolC